MEEIDIKIEKECLRFEMQQAKGRIISDEELEEQYKLYCGLR